MLNSGKNDCNTIRNNANSYRILQIPLLNQLTFITMPVQHYSDKELKVFLWVIVPYTTIINLIAFGGCLSDSVANMAMYTTLTALYFFAGYLVFGLTAVIIQNRFPSYQNLFKRISIMLPVFYLMNLFLVIGFYGYYEYVIKPDCIIRRSNFFWVLGFACFASTVITFLNEGVSNWSKWKASVTETEQLKNAYQKSRLYGLKGQINAHFLFNCFNSLSSLISEDEQRAEQFLNEMTKVHRYMLRIDDEQLVTLEDELKFAYSYLYLITTRLGSAIQYEVNVPGDHLQRFLPPLSLQVILENIIYTNTASKAEPLRLVIASEHTHLKITNSVQNKIMTEDASLMEGVDNLITKYRLIGTEVVLVEESGLERTIRLPLFNQKFNLL